MELRLTDSKGRQIPLIGDQSQNTLGNRSFECLLEVQTIARQGSHQHHFTPSPKEIETHTHGVSRPLVGHKDGMYRK
eukprot:1898531-Pleurochrysis_carterae.AAC.1